MLAPWSVEWLPPGCIGAAVQHDRVLGLLIGLTCGTAVVIATWHAGLGWLGLGLFAAGLTLAPTLAACYGVIAEVVAPARRTDAFAWAVTFILLGIGVGAAVGGVLADISPTWAFVAGTVGTLFAIAAWQLIGSRIVTEGPPSG